MTYNINNLFVNRVITVKNSVKYCKLSVSHSPFTQEKIYFVIKEKYTG